MTSYTGDLLIACPLCDAIREPAARVASIAVCANCGASLVVRADETVRVATGADTTALSAADLQTLRKARGRTR
jgi:hypothetical protein